MKILKDLERICEFHHVELILKGNAHYQLKGPLLVNYYPLSSKKTAYVAGTTGGRKHVTPEQAVKMCFQAPSDSCKKAKRSGNYYKKKRQLWFKKKIRNCKWCEMPLTLEPNQKNSATLEHIIPLNRGGLNNMNNMTLACEPCNQKRGSGMPELGLYVLPGELRND